MALNGDSALAFEIHIVEHLGLHVFGGYRLGVLEQSVGEGTFPVVDVGDDAEVAYVVHIVKCSLEGMISARKSKIGYGLLHFRPLLPSHAPKSVAARRSSLCKALESPTDAVALYTRYVRVRSYISLRYACAPKQQKRRASKRVTRRMRGNLSPSIYATEKYSVVRDFTPVRRYLPRKMECINE